MRRSRWEIPVLFVLALTLIGAAPPRTENPNPPDPVVKLVFIHHSTGGNWLADPSENELGGGLGRALMENNYYVSATNYGWGPDSIGDSTDIPNWLDWFSGPNSTTYLNALYNENGQNFGDFGSWPRLADDPGGENEIILFKSCFPNSDLEGNPDDPPDSEGWLSVGHAKYVYNEILKYFATRPDKLFIVITAPPLTTGSTTPQHAANARAFNQWLVNDWLAENHYTLPNVAVFDFYNVLTGPDNHHRYWNGEIQHAYVEGMNTEYYPSSDDHPSRLGNEKATEEFIPLLNIFYHLWAEGGTNQPVVTQPPAATATPQASTQVPGQTAAGGMLADFDTYTPSLDTYRDETTSTRITCAPANDEVLSGATALKIDFDVVAGSWSTCALSFDHPQDWSRGQGLVFALHAVQAGIPYNVIVYSGSPDNQETYINHEETPQDSAADWATIQIPWESFKRADWEADAGSPFDPSKLVIGIAFGFDGLASANNTGTVWVDDIALLGGRPPVVEPTAGQQPTEEQPTEQHAEPDGGGGGLPCLGSILLPLALAGMILVLRRR